MSQPVSIKTKDNQHVILRKLNANDLDRLTDYLHHLSDETKKRFAPHHYDKKSIIDFFSWPNENNGFVAEAVTEGSIIGYAVVKCGCLEHDESRLKSYGLIPGEVKCGTFAPSVADAWQSLDIGQHMLEYILKELKMAGIKKVVLWGGVQSNNDKAVKFYKKAGFKMLGEFEYFGLNYDMILDIDG